VRRSAVTLALRLSTVGRDVLDGSGLTVSDGKAVSTNIVDVGFSAGGVTVSVIGEKAVFVTAEVSTGVGVI
jgi:hypothetical protein